MQEKLIDLLYIDQMFNFLSFVLKAQYLQLNATLHEF